MGTAQCTRLNGDLGRGAIAELELCLMAFFIPDGYGGEPAVR